MQRRVTLWLLVALASGVALAGAVGVVAAQEDTPTGTPIDQHVDPDNASEAGDVDRLSEWLGGHVTERLEGSAIELSEGQYERADGLLSEDLQDRLGQYVDVAGDTDGESDDRAAETAEETAEEQRRLTENTTEYRDTLEEYRDARQRGDEAAARRHARTLEDAAANVQDAGTNVREGYEVLENETGRDLGEGQEAVEAVEENVTSTQATVREESFVTTALSVSANRSAAAFDAPARIEGRLVAANGTALANRSIGLSVAGQDHEVLTDRVGHFAVVYRPVTASVDAESVPVQYEADPASPYLGTTTNATLGIEQVEPDVAVSVSPETVAYGDEYAVEASVTVDDRLVPGVPVAMSVDGSRVGTATSTVAGESDIVGTVGAGLATGEHEVRAAVAREDVAIGPGGGSAALSVEERETTVSVNASVERGQLIVDGRLATAASLGVGGESVNLSVAGVRRTVETGQDGSFEGTYALDEGELVGVEGNQTVTAAYGGGPNLGAATGRVEVEIPSGAGGGGDVAGLAEEWLVAIAVGVVAVAVAAVVVGRRYLRRGQDVEPGGESADVEADDESQPEVSDAEHWLERAREALASGDSEGAIARAYAASYRRVQDQVGAGEDVTARELLALAEGRVDESVLGALSTVTEAHERATFAGAADVGASEAVAAADRVVGGGAESSGMADD